VAVLGCLTVKENISFSAALRLPSSMGKQKKQARVETVLSDLHLNAVADFKVNSMLTQYHVSSS
jgi:ATP-binding cassette subfamily G (WHITE) protein 2